MRIKKIFLAFYLRIGYNCSEERGNMDIEVNYKNKKRYKTARYPLHQGKFWTWLIWILSKIKSEPEIEKLRRQSASVRAKKTEYLTITIRILCEPYIKYKL